MQCCLVRVWTWMREDLLQLGLLWEWPCLPRSSVQTEPSQCRVDRGRSGDTTTHIAAAGHPCQGCLIRRRTWWLVPWSCTFCTCVVIRKCASDKEAKRGGSLLCSD